MKINIKCQSVFNNVFALLIIINFSTSSSFAQYRSPIAAINEGDEILCKATTVRVGQKVTQLSNSAPMELRFFNNTLRARSGGANTTFNDAVNAGNEVQVHNGKEIKITKFLKFWRDGEQESVTFFLPPDGNLSMVTRLTESNQVPMTTSHVCVFKK
jgi:hypothetical protein